MRILRSLAAAFARAWNGSARLRILLACALVLVVVAAVVAVLRSQPARKPGYVPRFSRVVLVVFENHEFDRIIGRPDAPTFNGLARRYALLKNYYAVAHPSLPNYIALVSGSTQGIASDCSSCIVDAQSLADTLEAAGRSWKVYAEGLPQPGFTGAQAGLYAKKHVPFLYFKDVLTSPRRLARIVPLSSLAGDLSAGTLPDFSLVVPNLCHNMHTCSIAMGDAWLAALLPSFLSDREMRGGVVFVAFDEGVLADTAHGGGHVPVIAAGPLVLGGARDSSYLDHYSLLRTIEQSWNLPLLGNSSGVAPITGIWRK